MAPTWIPRPRRPKIPIFAYLAVMGPGIITGAANNDAGGIATASVAGAEFRFQMLWVLALMTALLALTQEMGARMGAVTGKGLADLIREEYGIRAAVFAISVLLVANGAVTAAEFAGVGAAMELFGVSRYIAVPLGALVVWFMVSTGSFRRVERIFLVFVLFYFAYVISGLRAGPPWSEIGRALVLPKIDADPKFIALAIAIAGTTVAPWGQFFIQSYIRDKGVGIDRFKLARLDVLSGTIFASAIAFFIVISTALTLHPAGISVESAEEAARALGPVAGSYASTLFGVGLLAASVLAAGVLPLSTAYVVCEAFGWESGVGAGWRRAPQFNSIFTITIGLGAALVLIPGISLVRVMVIAQTLNGILLPVILVYAVRLASSRRIMGDQANGRVHSILVWAATVAIVAVTAVMLVQSF